MRIGGCISFSERGEIKGGVNSNLIYGQIASRHDIQPDGIFGSLRYFSVICPRFGNKGVPCPQAKAEIIPNEPDTVSTVGGIFLE